MTTVEALAKLLAGETIKRNDCTGEEWTFDPVTCTITETDGEFHIYMTTEEFLAFRSDEWYVAKKNYEGIYFTANARQGRDYNRSRTQRYDYCDSRDLRD